MEFLNNIEKNELEKLNENLTLVNAIKKVLLAKIYFEGTLLPGQWAGDPIKNIMLQNAAGALQGNAFITDEQLGQRLRADTQAFRLVELGFQELEKFKKIIKTDGKNSNPAR